MIGEIFLQRYKIFLIFARDFIKKSNPQFCDVGVSESIAGR
jgi:hypothetical protein